MEFDVILSLILFFVSLGTLFLYDKSEVKVKSLFGENKFRTRDAVLIVLLMGIMVTVIAFTPQLAIMVLILFVYTLFLFLFTYVLSSKWYLAILPPTLFLIFYFFYWNIYLIDIFAILFVVSITLSISGIGSVQSNGSCGSLADKFNKAILANKAMVNILFIFFSIKTLLTIPHILPTAVHFSTTTSGYFTSLTESNETATY